METLGANSAAEQTQNRDDSDVAREDFGALQHGFVSFFPIFGASFPFFVS